MCEQLNSPHEHAGSLMNDTAQCVSAPDIVAKLTSIDQMLDDMPEIQAHMNPAIAPGSNLLAEVLSEG